MFWIYVSDFVQTILLSPCFCMLFGGVPYFEWEIRKCDRNSVVLSWILCVRYVDNRSLGNWWTTKLVVAGTKENMVVVAPKLANFIRIFKTFRKMFANVMDFWNLLGFRASPTKSRENVDEKWPVLIYFWRFLPQFRRFTEICPATMCKFWIWTYIMCTSCRSRKRLKYVSECKLGLIPRTTGR